MAVATRSGCPSRRRALCGQPIGYGTVFSHHAGWRHLAHQDCVPAHLDTWTTLAQQEAGLR